MPETPFFAGIDYGSKMAGTTVICFTAGQELQFSAVPPKKNADDWIVEWVETNKPATVFLDAPCSLPGIYRGLPTFRDYHYRQCDRILGAMSPMFLGGLTARAMRLVEELSAFQAEVVEVYPGALLRQLQLAKGAEAPYKKGKVMQEWMNIIQAQVPTYSIDWPKKETTWHHVDAVLAWMSGARFYDGTILWHGDPVEGMIAT